jgi:hypothetical protein
MAITVTQLTTGASGTNSTSYATASVSPGASKLILVIVSTTVSTAGSQLFPNSVSGAGLTFTMIDDAPGADSVSSRQISVWRALNASPGTGTITITFPATMLNCQWKVIEVDGIDTSGTNGSGAIVQFAAGTEATTATPSVTLATFGDATNNAAIAGFVCAAATTFAAGTGFTEIGADQSGTSPNTTLGAEYVIGQDTSVDATWGASSLGQGFAIEVKAAGGATSYTLTADSGSFSETGTAAGLKAGRKVAGGSGAFVLTGTAAALKTARRIIAAGGSFVVTGTDATLTYDQAAAVLTAEPGSFAVAGTATGLRTARRLAAASGSFSISGTAAGLKIARVIQLTNGSFLITGTDATLTYSGQTVVFVPNLMLMGVG